MTRKEKLTSFIESMSRSRVVLNSTCPPVPFAAVQLRVQLGAICEAPVWTDHERGKNWAAVIRRDPTKPSGLGRRFFPRAKGDGFLFIVPRFLRPGDPVEFGCDFPAGVESARVERRRSYGFVVEIKPDAVSISTRASAVKAIRAGEDYAAAVPAPARCSAELARARRAAARLGLAELRTFAAEAAAMVAALESDPIETEPERLDQLADVAPGEVRRRTRRAAAKCAHGNTDGDCGECNLEMVSE